MVVIVTLAFSMAVDSLNWGSAEAFCLPGIID